MVHLLLALCLALLPTAHADDGVVLAVSYFENATGDPELAALRKGFAEMLITDLSVSDEVRLVERSRLEAILDEIELQQSPYVDPDTAVALGAGLGAALIVTGSYVVQVDTLRVDARVIDVESGEVLLAVKAKGSRDDFLAVQRSLAEQLLEALGAELSILDRKRLGQQGTSSYEAFSEYAEGLQGLDEGDVEAAKARFEAALEADPAFAAAQAQREAVERLSTAFDADRHAAQLATLETYWRGRNCACLHLLPDGEVFADASEADKLPYRLLQVGDTTWATGPTYWPTNLEIPVAYARLGMYDEAEAILETLLSERNRSAPTHMRHQVPGQWIAGGPNPSSDDGVVPAMCTTHQVAAWVATQQLELERAMEHLVAARRLPDNAYTGPCYSGMSLSMLGIDLDQPLRQRVEAALDDPAAFSALEAQRRARTARADAARAELERRLEQAPTDCAAMCPWRSAPGSDSP